jgi:hypothetical protein
MCDATKEIGQMWPEHACGLRAEWHVIDKTVNAQFDLCHDHLIQYLEFGHTFSIFPARSRAKRDGKGLTVGEARRRGICRICGESVHAKAGTGGFVMGFGYEHAHYDCMDDEARARLSNILRNPWWCGHETLGEDSCIEEEPSVNKRVRRIALSSIKPNPHAGRTEFLVPGKRTTTKNEDGSVTTSREVTRLRSLTPSPKYLFEYEPMVVKCVHCGEESPVEDFDDDWVFDGFDEHRLVDICPRCKRPNAIGGTVQYETIEEALKRKEEKVLAVDDPAGALGAD